MEDDLLDVRAACKFIGGTKPIDPATLWRGMKAGRYSRPIKISAQAVRWRRSELQRDLDRMIAERDNGEAA